jgi:hypothetical protein
VLTGVPEGFGPIVPGDSIDASSESLGLIRVALRGVEAASDRNVVAMLT